MAGCSLWVEMLVTLNCFPGPIRLLLGPQHGLCLKAHEELVPLGSLEGPLWGSALEGS